MKRSKKTGAPKPRLVTNKFGFKEFAQKPTEKDLQKFYADQYYQTARASYAPSYDAEELQFIKNTNAIRYSVVSSYFKNALGKKSLLDVGCGEAFTMKYFHQKGWQVTGLDFSIEGCRKHNPALQKYVVQGDIYRNIDALIQKGETFSCVSLFNVLEHVIDPVALLKKVRQLLRPNGLLVVDVPNDFSRLQMDLLKQGMIDREFWVQYPDHLNYFSKDSLVRTCEATGFDMHKVVGCFPIDYNLANQDTNYVTDPKKGKNCYRAMVWLENLQSRISIEKTVALYEAFAELGTGRNICGYFIKK